MTAREVALLVLRDVFPTQPNPLERGAQEALDYRLRRADLSSRDRAFATRLAYGGIKMRRTLDWYVQPYLEKRGKALPPTISEILRLAMYELRFAAAPPHATVSEWVGLAKRHGHRGTAGLVNAVLRSFLRDNPPEPQAALFEDRDDYLGLAYSFPTWIVRQWRELFGDERIAGILDAVNAPAQSAVVVNRTKTTRETLESWFEQRGTHAVPSAYAQDALIVSEASVAQAGECAAGGAWWVQSESSAMVVDILNPQIGESVLDACSGRGSKAMQVAARVGAEGSVLCVDRDARKIAELERRAAAADLRLSAMVADAATGADQRFDGILIDAPCSGTGVLGRHPEARWRKHPGDAERLALTQCVLLDALVPRLHPGGTIVYAVCSVDPRETTGVTEWFARTHNVERGLVPERFRGFETAAGDVLVPPGSHGRDGFFMARFQPRA